MSPRREHTHQQPLVRRTEGSRQLPRGTRLALVLKERPQRYGPNRGGLEKNNTASTRGTPCAIWAGGLGFQHSLLGLRACPPLGTHHRPGHSL
jgi:hypothetical protein